jgi:predicted dehydrogenase
MAPRLGFVGVGWIGTHRLKAVAESGAAEIVGIADANPKRAREALCEIASWAPHAQARTFEELLTDDVDGIVIATPNSEHPAQALAALENDHAVFCQKPLARTGSEAALIVDTARERDRLLCVDLCYRRVAGVAEMKALLASGALGEVYAAELVFHNAYGPDKPWFYDVRQSGGGCAIDLGIHLIDLLLWALDYPVVERIESRLYAGGRLLRKPVDTVEDYAIAELHVAGGLTARLACSWRLSAGRDAIIEASFFGTRGAVRLANINGSFYDFRAEHYEGTRSRELSTPSSAWGGLTICDWARQLRTSASFNPDASHLTEVHRVVDALYGR